MTRDRQALDLETQRDRLVEAALAHVPFDGWTRAALVRGAADLGLGAADADRLFPGNAVDMIERMNRIADARMVEAFRAAGAEDMRIRDKIATAVRLRLEWALPHREAVRRGLAILALPIHGPAAARMLYRTVDAIWKAAGDRSTDYNFYTKRGLLAGVYMSTLLYWLNDHSQDRADSWAFLDRRIGDVMRVPKATGRLKALAQRLPNPARLARARRMGTSPRG